MGFKNGYYSLLKRVNTREVTISISNRIHLMFSVQITDNEGCDILVKGLIDHKEVTLLTIHRPLVTVYQKFFELILTESLGVLICGGDGNAQHGLFKSEAERTAQTIGHDL